MQDVSQSGLEAASAQGLFQDVCQGTEAWRLARCGKVTASRVADIIRKTLKGISADRQNYASELVVERLTGAPADNGFVSAAMQHGIDAEHDARRAYQFYIDMPVITVGFVNHPTIVMAGASPDGLVGDFGLVEIKCPQSKKHIQTLLGAPIDPDYATQMLWQMACTGRGWCDFVSFDPRMPPDMQLHVVRFDRDDVRIASLEAEVRKFLTELAETEAALLKRYREAA